MLSRLRLIDGYDPTLALVRASSEDDPAEPPAEDIGDRAQNNRRARPLCHAAPALEEWHRELPDGGSLPPHLEKALGIGEGAIRLERDRLDQPGGIHADVLVVPHWQLEEGPNQQIVDDGYERFVEGIRSPPDEARERHRVPSHALEHVRIFAEIGQVLAESREVIRPVDGLPEEIVLPGE